MSTSLIGLWLCLTAIFTALALMACVKVCKLDAFIESDVESVSNGEDNKSKQSSPLLIDKFMALPPGGKGIVIYFLVDLVLSYVDVIKPMTETSEFIGFLIFFYAFEVIFFVISFYVFYCIMTLFKSHKGDVFARRNLAAWITIISGIAVSLLYTPNA